jgi:hypothetical protein
MSYFVQMVQTVILPHTQQWDKLTVSHFIKVMEMQNIQLLELLTLS